MTADKITVGDHIESGAPYADEWDHGEVVSIDGDMVTVAWVSSGDAGEVLGHGLIPYEGKERWGNTSVTIFDHLSCQEELSAVRGECDSCGTAGWIGDYPGQGGLVVDEACSQRICDSCDSCGTAKRAEQ